MKIDNPNTSTDVGVIVGRFQVPYLHDAHSDLIETVRSNHKRVIIFLGVSPLKATQRNPLDFQSRKQMISEKFPDVDVLFIKDNRSDVRWSQDIDQQIRDIVGPLQSVTLYGSRDSFLPHYRGGLKTQALISDRIVSGTELRRDACAFPENSPHFRAGAIWALTNQYQSVIPTVDVAIIDEETDKILLGRKPTENHYRFIGGFADPRGGGGFEGDAKREVFEETGITIRSIEYVGSYPIEDWRYLNERNQIVTTFFLGYCRASQIQAVANDDIAEVRWFKRSELNTSKFVIEHKVLYEALLNHNY